MYHFKLFAVDLSKNFLDFISGEIEKIEGNFFLIFPNKRPLRFIESNISFEKQLEGNFFSLSDFVNFVVLNFSENPPKFLGNIERILFILKLLDEIEYKNKSIEEIFKGNPDKKIPWGIRLLSLLGDMEMQLDEKDVKDIEYLDSVPEEAKKLLENLKEIYGKFRKKIVSENVTFGGDTYKRCINLIDGEFKRKYDGATFLFCGFSYLTKRERELIERIRNNFNTSIYFQTDLKKRHGEFNPYEIYEKWLDGTFWKKKPHEIISDDEITTEIFFYESFNTHSEIMQFSEVFEDVIKNVDRNELKNPQKLGIILPEYTTLFPLYMSILEDVPKNITLGLKFSLTPFGKFLNSLLSCVLDYKVKGKLNSKFLIELLNSEISLRLNFLKPDEIEKTINYIYQNNLNFIPFENLDFLKDDEIEEILRKVFKFLIEPFLEVKSFMDFGKALEKTLERIEADGDFYRFLKNYLMGEIVLKLKGMDERFLDLNLDIEFFYHLLRGIMENLSIPFEGNPLKGIQIMGVLEARGLSFENLMVLDVNEGILPYSEKVDPLFPEDLKMEYGLSTFKDREKLIRYNFFRMVDSSKKVHLFYQRGESANEKKLRSRFIEELILEEELKGKREKLKRAKVILNPEIRENGIERDEKIDLKIDGVLKENRISPTLLNLYLNCPYSFYLKYVLKVGEEIKITETFRADKIGTLVHYVLEKEFGKKKGEELKVYLLNKIKENVIREIENFINYGKFSEIETGDEIKEIEKYFKNLSHLKKLMFLEVINKRMTRLFSYFMRELKKLSVKVLEVEKKIELDFGDYKFYGKLDRIDEVKRDGEHFYRIIDYKTGSKIKKVSFKKVKGFLDNLENYALDEKSLKALSDSIGSIQLPLYIFLYSKGEKIDVNSIRSVYYVPGSGEGGIKVEFEFRDVLSLENFQKILEFLINHIKSSKKIYAFNSMKCEFCSYKKFCKFNI